MRQQADPFPSGVDQLDGLTEIAAQRVGIEIWFFAKQLKIDLQCSHRLTGLVVELARNSLPFLFLGINNSASKLGEGQKV